ncbi:MAG: hypothetical protein HXL18_01615 [Peptostreptococcus sp.]|nr:hypothetical protein [Peptostreptococcus sp.]
MGKLRIKKEFYESTEMILRNHRGIIRHVGILENTMSEINEYKTRGIKAVSTDGVRVSSCNGDPIGKQVVKVSEMIEKIQREIKDEKKYIILVKKGMAELSDEEREIIEMRYFDNIPDCKIAEFTSYERSWVQRKRAGAVRKIAVALFGMKCLELNKDSSKISTKQAEK